MTLAYSFFVGLFVTVFAIAVLMKIAHFLGAVDHPGPRKVHQTPIPRIGGIAIALSTWVAILLWLPVTRPVLAFLGGSLIIVLVGIWDDIRNLNYKLKVVGQALGIVVLLWGGGQFSQLPFFGIDEVPAYIAYPVAFIFLFGVTNASNLFDGLDGLAGGCLALSIATISFLAILAEDALVPTIGLALIGGTLGFLRYNTHPASIFMGDAGSQFLGFTAGFLSIHLVTVANPTLSPALPFLVLGLPLIDTFSVTVRRILQNRSPFVGDKQHLHHRLLARGLTHAQTVSILYLIQLTMVIVAFMIRHQSDLFVLGTTVLFGLATLGTLYGLERKGMAIAPAGGHPSLIRTNGFVSRKLLPLAVHARATAAVLFLIFMVAGAILSRSAAHDIAIMCGAVAVASTFGMIFLRGRSAFFIRLSAYVASLVLCFLLLKGGAQASIWTNWPTNLSLAIIGGIVILGIMFAKDPAFAFSSQDLLMMVMVLIVPMLDIGRHFDFSIGMLILQASVLFYSIEYVLSGDRKGTYLVSAGSVVALLAISIKGVI